jgi:hypothetical protein
MGNNKQSSVEWLISQLQKSKDFHRVINEVSQMSTAKIDMIEQAKAMHEEEIKNTHGTGRLDRHNDFSRTPEQYYNETFGG